MSSGDLGSTQRFTLRLQIFPHLTPQPQMFWLIPVVPDPHLKGLIPPPALGLWDFSLQHCGGAE